MAQHWADNIKDALGDSASVKTYIGSLTGNSKCTTNGAYKRARVVYVPAGMVLPITLCSSISSSTANVGDPVKAKLTQDVTLSDAVIPAGSTLYGKITEVKAGEKMAHAGQLAVKFDGLRTPDGSHSPICAHLVGGLDNLRTVDSDICR